MEPVGERPYMPGYGIKGAAEGAGLLPWSWAQERLHRSRNYWLASVREDGRPHVMPVWGVWDGGCFWFSSSVGSRKIRNLRRNPFCTVTTEETQEPVVVEGRAEIVTAPEALERMRLLENDKYATELGPEMFDPAINATVRVRPLWAFALDAADFTGTPTRWTLEPS